MRRRNKYNNNAKNVKKERAIMIASTVFVLAALTMTGVYVKQYNNKSDGYNIDFSALDNVKGNEENNQVVKNNNKITNLEDDLDYFSNSEEAGSGLIHIPGLSQEETTASTKDENKNAQKEEMNEGNKKIENEEDLADEAAIKADAENELTTNDRNQTLMDEARSSLSFNSGDKLVWPVNGNVLINYSMEKTVYFATLQQYKYSPSIVIAAKEGDTITASASGIVKEVFYNEEIGNAVKVDIGNGYEITYGQLKDIQVSADAYIEAGSIIGFVAAPTKYYSVEGTNVYFALKKDGKSVNPMGQLE